MIANGSRRATGAIAATGAENQGRNKLRDIEEMSAEEAAEAIGITVGALKSRLLRARLMMREALAVSLEQPPTISKKLMHGAQDMGMAVAMRMMRAAGK